MVNISENNESQYLRNRNFSSTIVLELTQTNTRDKQCVGVVFDVDTSNNDVSRLFFWHTGELLPNHYRSEGRCLTTAEMREYLQRSFTPEQFYCDRAMKDFGDSYTISILAVWTWKNFQSYSNVRSRSV